IGPASVEQAQNIRVLLNGAIPEICNPLSGIIAAKHIGRIVFDKEKPSDVIIIAESVGEGAPYADLTDVGCIPLSPLDESQAMKFLQDMTTLIHSRY
ncbi:MAG: hypothetical protein NTZ24_03735, partial [Deltaproteobacteria bacterium]|nr:hypothetical protein [Deltaproteobacteria bacterium]